MVTNFSFSYNGNIIVGARSIQKITEIVKQHDQPKVMIVSDRGIEKAGLVKRLVDLLETNCIPYCTFLDVLPNPTVKIVEEAAKHFKEENANYVIALGGGSSMDVSKAVGVLATYGGDIHQYAGANRVPGRITPIIAVPTTAGTGSEVTSAAVITDEEKNLKFSILSKQIVPQYAILDATLIESVPAFIASTCGMDALIHAIEAYISTKSNHFTDALAEKAMELIGSNIKLYTANRKNTVAAESMLLGSLLAGLAFDNARLGNVHGMSHPVSAYYHVAHGLANAILLPYVLEYNAMADTGKYKTIYKYVTGKENVENFETSMLVQEINRMNELFGIPKCLSSVGVDDEHINDMVTDAMKTDNVATANPRSSTFKELGDLYRIAIGLK